MKRIALTIFAFSVFSGSFAQIKLADRLGNLKTVQAGREPWNIQTTDSPSSDNDDAIYQTGNVGIGDFSTITGTEKLDVNGNLRVREMVDGTDRSLFPNVVVAKNDGTFGTAPRGGAFQAAVSGTTVIGYNTEVLHLYSANQTDITFPTTLSAGAYDGRIIHIMCSKTTGNTMTNVKFYTLPGEFLLSNTVNIIPPQSSSTFVYKGSGSNHGWYRIHQIKY